MSAEIRKAKIEDVDSILLLYQKVAAIEGGLARKRDEINEDYISSFVQKSIHNGAIYIAEDENTLEIIGEIHCYSPCIEVFSHIFSELTIAVDPDKQRRGIGRMLFRKLLDDVVENRSDILRVELIARESNEKAIRFYESLGFKIEGRFVNRIKSVIGCFEADIPMAWIR